MDHWIEGNGFPVKLHTNIASLLLLEDIESKLISTLFGYSRISGGSKVSKQFSP